MRDCFLSLPELSRDSNERRLLGFTSNGRFTLRQPRGAVQSDEIAHKVRTGQNQGLRKRVVCVLANPPGPERCLFLTRERAKFVRDYTSAYPEPTTIYDLRLYVGRGWKRL